MARVGMIIYDGIGPVLAFMAVNTAVKASTAMEQGAWELEMYAKQNAPWADRSGQARDGLIAGVSEEGGEIVIDLAHTAEHGYWLELIQDGRFAIIMPTLEALGPEIIRNAGASVIETGGA